MKVLCTGLVWFIACLGSPSALAVKDELRLSAAEQKRLNNISLATISGQIAVHNASIVLGFVPVPMVSYPAEVAALGADNTLKFTKAFLKAPPDIAVLPNADGNCRYTFELPQATAGFDSFLGLWPKLGNDRLFSPYDTPINFGILGVPEIMHANTEVVLSVHSPTAGISRDVGESSQIVQSPAGIHTVEWRADTQYYPVWDLAVPTVTTAVMMGAEFKFAKHIKKLKKARSDTLELASVKRNTAALVRQLDNLNDRIDLFKRFETRRFGGEVLFAAGIPITGELIVEKFFEGKSTVTRSRNQRFTVYDVLPPEIATSEPVITFEASDLGGLKSFRKLAELEGTITASDACERSVTIENNIPFFFPLSTPDNPQSTVVTWIAKDAGPAHPNGAANENGVNVQRVTQTVIIEDTQAPIMVPPPAVVIEGTAPVSLADEALGQPLVVDLADLHPVVTNSATQIQVEPDHRLVVTWSTMDDSGNTSTAEQLVTVKTPGTNTAPTAYDKTAETITSKPVNITLTGTDADILDGRNDPLSFSIVDRPVNGEFIAPLLPFFINDYRTDISGVFTETQELAFANAPDQEDWLRSEFCEKYIEYPDGIPVNFVFNPLFVQVTEAGESYFLDHYAVCNPFGDFETEVITRQRISRWDKDRSFMGYLDYDFEPGVGLFNTETFLMDKGIIYYLQAVDDGSGDAGVNICDSALASCSTVRLIDGAQPDSFSPEDAVYVAVDSQTVTPSLDPLFYVTDKKRVAIYQSQGGDGQPVGQLVNDVNNADFIESASGCAPLPRVGANSPRQAFGMAVDSAGNIYVADTCAHKIHKFAAASFNDQNILIPGQYVGWMGRCTATINQACDLDPDRLHSKGFSCTNSTCTGGGAGAGIGQFNHPVYLAIDPNDVLYVADYTNSRIQRFAPDGTFVGQAKSTGNGINANTEGAFVLGNMGPPRHVSVNSKQFFVVDQGERFVHVFGASPFKDITDSSATVEYVSNFSFNGDTDTFTYSVNDGLVDSNVATVSVNVTRNYRQPLPSAQTVTTDEDRSVVFVLSGSDPDGIINRDFNGLDSLTFLIRKQPEFGMLALGGDPGDVTLDPGTEVWTYTPNRDYHGSDSFSFTVRDTFTDETFDGATPIPEPYGEADLVNVDITVAPVNDIPIVLIDSPERVAAGFPILLQATVYDDIGNDYAATLDWGDGQVERDGGIEINDKGTPKDSSDDEAMLTGVTYSIEGLNSIGESPVSAMHSYTAMGNHAIELCLRDDGPLETCDSVDIEVKHLVVLGTELVLSDDELADGVPFGASINIINGQPEAGVTGLDASGVTVQLEIPEELILSSYTPSQGSCSVDQGALSCSLGILSNAAMASVDLVLRGKGTLIYDQDILLDADVSTTTPALEPIISSSISVLLEAVILDRDDDGLPNIFEAFYGVSDPVADDDDDGLDNFTELEQGTSPIDNDSDGDSISDGDEISIYDTDPTENDTDGDGLNDNDELFIHGTNPLSSDSDNDGLPDQWEIDNSFDPLLADSSGDADSDGLSDLEEFQSNTDFQVADTDGDGLLDGDEVYIHQTNPLQTDTDEDGLDDNIELLSGTDLLKPDTDDDGLLDGAEVNVYGSLPLVTDTDRDGLPDGWETRNNRNLLKADYMIAGGSFSTCALTDTGVQCWGRNNLGQAPANVGGLVDPIEVTAGVNHACALDVETDGSRSVKCWGQNVFNQLNVPALVEPLQIAAGNYHTCALDRTAPDIVEVKCWGRDNNNFNVVSTAPTDLENPVKLVSAISGQSSCVLDEKIGGPELICWGQYNNANTVIPTGLTSSDGVLAHGAEHGCIVDSGDRMCWGLNNDGQAPIGPVPTTGVQLALGGFHSCSLDQYEPNKYSVACWGRDVSGQASVPISLNTPHFVTAGRHHSCALDGGVAQCWGLNTDNQAPASRVLAIDPDGDGVLTADEIANGTNPLDADSDRDQLSDNLEIEFSTDPLNDDSDEDGISDADEIYVHLTNPNNNDTDADGLPDGWEVDNGLMPTFDDAANDNDADGLSNSAEFDNGTDPGVADSDSDGLDDGAELAMFRFENSGQALGTAISEAVELGDLDGDGDFDAFVANRVGGSAIWINDGEGTFTLDSENTLNMLEALDVALGDIDLDGDLDAVLAHPVNTQSNTLWLNGFGGDPVGKFTDSAVDFGPGISDGVKLRIEAPESALPKLFVANWGATQTHLFDGVSLVFSTVSDAFAGNSEDIAIGDLDGDNLDDAFVVNRDQPNQVFRASDPLQSTMTEIPQGAFVSSDTSIAVALGDLDGDGDLDAFEVIFGAGDRIWLNDGFGNFTDSGQLIGNDNGNDVSLLDIDKDGDMDAIVVNIGANKLWLNDGMGMMSDSGVSIGSDNGYGLSLGDVDDDSDTDIFVANDGPNIVWLLSQLDPSDPDSDGDGMFDGWEVSNGLDPLDESDGELDSDFDGLSNAGEFDADTEPNNSDSDADGMPDGWEVSNGLDPLFDDSGLDLDIDGLSNLEEFQQGGVPEADDVPPVVTAPGDVSADSTGLLTVVAVGSGLAIDVKDGVVPATVDDSGPYDPGSNNVTWSAADFSGNVGVDNQLVDVTPIVNFAIDQVVGEGAVANVGIELNGSAVNYPVQVDYSISGTAKNPDDHDAVDGSVMIDSGNSGAIAINIAQDVIFEADETLTLTIDSVVNAVAGSQASHTLTIAEKNITPTATIIVMQQGKPVTTVAADGGLVTVTATIIDPNPGDNHSFDWSASDSGIFDLADFIDSSYSVDPLSLGEGLYRIVVNITDDGSPVEINNVYSLVRIVATSPVLSATTDSDDDGVSDFDEGIADSDGDGVPDYLDANNATSVLLLSDDGYMLETQTGLNIRLGNSAFAAGQGARLTEAEIAEDFGFYYPDGVVDFEVLGVEPGNSAMVVIPLRQSIPAGASYRKYMNGAWQDFVEDGDNMIFSAPGSNGACPPPGDIGYLPGLNQGDSCIQLLLQDGGSNDSDGLANGAIIDPSGLSLPLPADVTLEILPVSDMTASANSTDNVVLALRITTDAGGVELESLTLQASGSGDDREISKVNLVIDANQNKLVDAGDMRIGFGTFNLDNGSLTLHMNVPYTLPPGPTDMLVTLDF